MEVKLFATKDAPDGRAYRMLPIDGNTAYRVSMFTGQYYPGLKECGVDEETWLRGSVTRLDLKIVGPFLDILIEPVGHFFLPSGILVPGYELSMDDFKTIMEVMNFFGASVASKEATQDGSSEPLKQPLPKAKRKAKA